MSFSKKTWQSNANTPLNIDSMNDLENRVNNAFEATTQNHLYAGVELDFTWAQLQAKAQAGDFSGLNVGDYKTITMNGKTVRMQIAGMDTYYKTTDQQLGHHIDFISKDCFPTTVQWNTTNNNNGTADQANPYLASNLYTWLNETLYGYLPSDVTAVIAEKRMLLESRYSASGALTDSTSWAWGSMGKLWVPTEYEVFGAVICGTPKWSAGHAVQYPIFANSWLNRIKGAGDDGSRCSWWLCTANSGYSTDACLVGGYGFATSSYTSSSNCVPVCFRLA